MVKRRHMKDYSGALWDGGGGSEFIASKQDGV